MLALPSVSLHTHTPDNEDIPYVIQQRGKMRISNDPSLSDDLCIATPEWGSPLCISHREDNPTFIGFV